MRLSILTWKEHEPDKFDKVLVMSLMALMLLKYRQSQIPRLLYGEEYIQRKIIEKVFAGFCIQVLYL